MGTYVLNVRKKVATKFTFKNFIVWCAVSKNVSFVHDNFFQSEAPLSGGGVDYSLTPAASR